MTPPEKIPLPLIQTPQEIHPIAARNATPPSLSDLARMVTDLGRPPSPTRRQHITHLVLLEQLQDALAQAVEVLCQRAQVDGFRICLERVHDARAEARGQVECYEGLGPGGRGGGDGEHLAQPEREVNARAGFEGVAGGIVEVAEGGNVELEGGWDFLGGC
jgi:hypothetical protein